jgi:pimeloyl-ACP methyl ester carboxylesterase
MSERDPLGAFNAHFRIALAGLNLLQGDPDTLDHQVAIVGRGIGGEVAAAVATHTGRCQVVVAVASLPDRSRFIEHSPHPLAAGLRQFHSAENLRRQIDGLAPRALIRQLDVGQSTQWLLQIAGDDDRLSDTDRQVLTMSIPRTVRVRTHQTMRDLAGNEARRERLDFVTNLCGRRQPKAG